MRRLIFSGMVAISLFSLSQAQTSSRKKLLSEAKQSPTESASGARLPIRRVVLYKNGVGYFEHLARVRGDQELTIDFTTAQLNDVLKSLTVVDLGEGHIASVRYNSIAPLDERLKSLRLSLGEAITRVDFLTALRGARVEVQGGLVKATGRLLSVEKETRVNEKGDSHEITDFSILTDNGEMRNFELNSGTSVRLAEPELNEEVGKYLNLLGSSRARDSRRMTISAAGSGERDIFVSYISEVPAWKSTYRIMVPAQSAEKGDEKEKGKPLLQGWAIVDNTVGEDWESVRLSLVAGAPQSFMEDISQPFYVRRPVVALPPSVMLTPQEHEGTLSAGAGVGGGIGSGSGAGVGEANQKQFDQLQTFARLNAPPPPPPAMPRSSLQPAELQAGIANQHVEAEAKAAGDYFEYDVTQRISIGKNQSALVPILQARIEAEKVSIWNEDSREIRRALWLTNSSGLTLDSGTFNILDGDTFAGEGLIETVHPAERRLISYAADPALHVKMEEESNDRPITRVRIAKGFMILTHERRDNRKYTLHNADTTPRQVVIEHPARPGWKLAEGAKPEEATASFLRFRVAVEAGKTATLQIEEYHPEETEYQLSELDNNQVTLIAQQKQITPELREVFRKVLAQKNQVDRLQAQTGQRRQEVDAITRDQARLRENMKALKGSAEEKALLQRYTRQLDSQEDRLGVLGKQISDLDEQKTQADQQLDQMVQQVTLDENF